MYIQVLATLKDYWQKISCVLLVLLLSCFVINPSPAWAGIDDDRYDGNIFALYAGNGSLVPPRVSLAESLKGEKPAILFFYVDDSSDCKQFSIVISRLQAYYGRAASFIPVDIDAIPVKAEYSPTEPGYYYQGLVPQTVVIDGQREVAFNEVGQVAYEKIDDSLREVFDLLPRSESEELKRRSFNEFNTELSD